MSLGKVWRTSRGTTFQDLPSYPMFVYDILTIFGKEYSQVTTYLLVKYFHNVSSNLSFVFDDFTNFRRYTRAAGVIPGILLAAPI